ncbi:MAG: hypothetical protein COB65_06305 [Thalassobium sp.]|nr:MAG: hypothetical protein COB65_06305 [Thalassobium sp.]
MKYPKLVDKNDLRRKLMDKDIASLQIAHAKKPIAVSARQWRIKMAKTLGVSPATVQYHTDPDYQAKMKAKNAKAHSKDNPEDYANHRAQESKRRVERWDRSPDLREWHYVISAKNEKRTVRKTVLGKELS